jgi:hypothetical protein
MNGDFISSSSSSLHEVGCQGTDTVGGGGVVESLRKSHGGRRRNDSVWRRGGVACVHRSSHHGGKPGTSNLEWQHKGHWCRHSVVVDNLGEILGKNVIIVCDTCLDEDSAKIGVPRDAPIQRSIVCGERAGQIFGASVGAEELRSTR